MHDFLSDSLESPLGSQGYHPGLDEPLDQDTTSLLLNIGLSQTILSSGESHAPAMLRSDMPAAAELGSVASVAQAVLRALADMARASTRHEAELDSALERAALRLTQAERLTVLDQLVQDSCLGRIIPLFDGGTMVSVTPTGMTRARDRW